MGSGTLPGWVQELRQTFRSEVISQFIISGNVHDVVRYDEEEKLKYLSLTDYLTEIILKPFDVVIFYDRAKGIRVRKGSEHFFQFTRVFDKFHSSQLSSGSGATTDPIKSLESPGMLPRQPGLALELIDRFLTYTHTLKSTQKGKPLSIALILNYANFLFPRGESLYLSGEIGGNIIKILDWAKDPNITSSNIIAFLISENTNDLHESLISNPYISKIKIELPDEAELKDYIDHITASENSFKELCGLSSATLAGKLVGLSKINVKNLIFRAIRNNLKLDEKQISRIKKDIIEKEAGGLLEFMESRRTLDDVAGHSAAKEWLREDAQLLKLGASQALPMGYLIAGRIGTGKTYLVQCYAGECGVPFVELKNFRDKWVGATEGNLEKIFNILHALGQVVVFIDEADQITGRRDSGGNDSGLSGRVYGMLAKEMSETANRGKILWIFATSRPDLLEVDLKRPGRLDVHIPLFPPQTLKEKQDLFLAMAAKLKLDLEPGDLPDLSDKQALSGNELESMLVRAIRQHALQGTRSRKKTFKVILKSVVSGFRPSAHTTRLEFMDLLAVKECTDERFLPQKYRILRPEETDRRILELSYVR